MIHCLQRLAAGLASRLRRIYFTLQGVKFDGSVWLRAIEIPRNPSDIHLGENVALDRGITLLCTATPRQGKLTIGARTYVNRHTFFDVSEGLIVGTDCMIGPFCYLTDHDHGTSRATPIREQSLLSDPVVIGNDVWIGAHVTILKGTRIGDGAIIGAGSIVTRDIPPNSIAFGAPAKPVRQRS